jgi:hypothetical protein
MNIVDRSPLPYTTQALLSERGRPRPPRSNIRNFDSTRPLIIDVVDAPCATSRPDPLHRFCCDLRNHFMTAVKLTIRDLVITTLEISNYGAAATINR